MFTRTHAQASPSVTVEKGIPRLRPVRPRPTSKRIHEEGSYPRPFLTDYERRASALLASFAFVIMLCVCLALYIMSRSSRWEPSLLQLLSCSKLALSSPGCTNPLHPFVVLLSEPRRSERCTPALDPDLRDSSEQYISYLPHSGFHNQRIALENALVLAYVLNRTLLIPPVYLGEPPLRYRPSRSLYIDVALSSQSGLEHCADVDNMLPVPEECTDFWTHAQVPWEWFVNLTLVTQQHNIRSFPRQDLTDAFLLRFGVTPAGTFFLSDTAPYQFRLFDRSDDIALVGPRYTTRIDLPELVERTRAYRLLQFGTLFGTARLHLMDPVHTIVRRDVRRAMVFANPALLARAAAVRDSEELGSEWSYVAVHLRLGDGVFSDEYEPFRTARNVWWRLVRELGVSDDAAAEMEEPGGGHIREPPPLYSRGSPPLRVPHRQPPLLPLHTSTPTHQEATCPFVHLPLYIATDTPAHPAIELFTRTFSRVYFLTNFSKLLDNVTISQASPLIPETAPSCSAVTMIAPKKYDPHARFLAPFLDALIASNARVVIGTPGSTFSQFVEDVLWRRYHGWEIVEHG